MTVQLQVVILRLLVRLISMLWMLKIARLEKEISIKQAQYDSYMSQVEALINGEETPEVPETPEEGGEETPAE